MKNIPNVPFGIILEYLKDSLSIICDSGRVDFTFASQTIMEMVEVFGNDFTVIPKQHETCLSSGEEKIRDLSSISIDVWNQINEMLCIRETKGTIILRDLRSSYYYSKATNFGHFSDFLSEPTKITELLNSLDDIRDYLVKMIIDIGMSQRITIIETGKLLKLIYRFGMSNDRVTDQIKIIEVWINHN